jgi:hypothetical protein
MLGEAIQILTKLGCFVLTNQFFSLDKMVWLIGANGVSLGSQMWL